MRYFTTASGGRVATAALAALFFALASPTGTGSAAAQEAPGDVREVTAPVDESAGDAAEAAPADPPPVPPAPPAAAPTPEADNAARENAARENAARLPGGVRGAGAGRMTLTPPADEGYAPAIRYPDSGFSFLDHSSTAAEGALRGAGALARGVGSANLDHSLAAMNYQEAYRRSLENSLRYAETYYARRDLWFDYQENTRRPPLSMEGYRRIAQAEGADRLAADQFDAESGQIRWPDLLQADVLEPYRTTIEEALANRSMTDVGLGSRTYERVRLSVEAMQSILDRNRKALPTHLYVNATQFLESVLFESRFAPPSNRVAE